MHQNATRTVASNSTFDKNNHCQIETQAPALSLGSQKKQKKVCKSLLEHWEGLNIFVENPAVKMDNNKAENAIRGPVIGRKNYYGSGSIWSAELAATLFSILQTLELHHINPRH